MMKRLLFLAIFTLCLSGLAYAQDPAAPPSVGCCGDGFKVGVSINTDGRVKVGEVVIREGKSSETRPSSGPTRDQGASSGAGQGPKRDPWEGLRTPEEKRQIEASQRESKQKDTGPRESKQKDTGPRETPEPRGGKREIGRASCRERV